MLSIDIAELRDHIDLPMHIAIDRSTNDVELRFVVRLSHLDTLDTDRTFIAIETEVAERSKHGRWFSWFSERGALVAVSGDADLAILAVSCLGETSQEVVAWFCDVVTLVSRLRYESGDSLRQDPRVNSPTFRDVPEPARQIGDLVATWPTLEPSHSDARVRVICDAIKNSRYTLNSHNYQCKNEASDVKWRETKFVVVGGNVTGVKSWNA
ncbi:hypothetical protein [Rhodococcus sp. 14-2483-1-2]|uniref:hypothetical protein n=1 Tax=Rhodococcus sp. 14-2483-1-2 TaxID=2023147 RepID=UPI00113FF884|nr:hypothetical protein [Rhodococcus sp. 14-2483-1-2]